MATQSRPYYWLTCDYPGCTARSTDDSDYGAWEDTGQAADEAINAEWYVGELGDYCSEHTVMSEEEDDLDPEPRPMGTSFEEQLAAAMRRVVAQAERRADSVKWRLHNDGAWDRRLIAGKRELVVW
jgi:hypothetical protein